ncbi:winged helix-turn-helix transcriptional regulator [Paraburkholderia sediminicola]|uniref:winged helix-turn-helix transcriptional regulator n=1 Tax=Paraburkholderia sediminicola TaxID=458836 RepID=UPI0038BB3756
MQAIRRLLAVDGRATLTGRAPQRSLSGPTFYALAWYALHHPLCETIISAKSCDHKKALAGFILSPRKLIATTGLAPTTVRRKEPKTLRQLERDGLVSRYMHPAIPPRVGYRLTPAWTRDSLMLRMS